MSKNFIKIALEDLADLNTFEKSQLNDHCNIAIKEVKQNNGKANNITIVLTDEDEYTMNIVAKRKRKYNRKTPEDKIRSIGLSELNETKLIEKINKAEINNNHVVNIRNADINDALVKLPPGKQNKVIESIIKNTNEKHLINREEIASESIQNGNIDLAIVENWYKGIIRAGGNFQSKLYINKEVLEFLSKEQVKELYELVDNTIKKCNGFLKSMG